MTIIFGCKNVQTKNVVTNKSKSESQYAVVSKDNITINDKCAIFFYPDSIWIANNRKDVSEDEWQIIVDDNLHYMFEAERKLQIKNIKVIDTLYNQSIEFIRKDQKRILINRNQFKEGWYILLFNPEKGLKKIKAIDIDEGILETF